MSDLMLHGVLNMPPELWVEGDSRSAEFDKAQRFSRYQEASDRITKLTDALDLIASGFGETKKELEGIAGRALTGDKNETS